MKRITTIMALALMMAMPVFAERVTPETAHKVATTFLQNNGAKSAQLTDLTKAAGFNNLYIFTAEQGFVVMAADDCVQPILGYSLTGTFVAENMPDNVRGWLQGYNDEIQWGIDHQVRANAETAKQWKELSEGNAKAGRATAVVDNLLTTIWDQDPLYNNLCPFSQFYNELTVTGCVATAMAQIMKYWEHPSRGIGSHTYTHTAYVDNNGYYHDAMGELSADFGNTIYDWDNMPTSLNSSSTEAQIDAIATLMYHCGVSVDMDYGVAQIGGSGAVTAYVADALQEYFGYQQSIFRYKANYESSWVSMLKTELDNGRPLQYSGRGSGGGHSFVCCGYDSDDNFYFNWGWSGRNDGFYALNNLVPGSGGSGGAGYSFTQDQAAIFGIQPNTPSINPPTIATAVNGTDVTITWNEVSNAASYKLYRNGNLVASSLTTTSYTDTNLPYGEHAYYVKSVKSDGTMSLKSNISVATVSFEGPVPTDLTATLSGYNVNLSWTAPVSESAILQYGSGNPAGNIGFSGQAAMYWAQRYPVTTLASYAGMGIDKVSVYFAYTGTYTLYIYNGNETGTTGLMYQTDYTASSTGWKDINVTNVPLDYTSDLWVVMYAPISIAYPAVYCSYSGSGVENASYYSSSGSGWSSTGNNISWLMKTYISDGTFTYNLYDGTNPVASNIEGTSYAVSNIADNAAHQYTVKTNYYGGESAASNMVGFAVGTASIQGDLTLGDNDMMTVTQNSKLSVSGTMSNDSPENLILEDGAQLVHNSEGVKATVQKNIEPYSGDEDGWYFIASPVTETIEPSADNGLLANTYDLYLFDQSEELEWRNIRTGAFSTIDHKTGYLYANNANTALTFAGTLAATAEPTTLDYDNNAILKGFNLVGNPYPCNVTTINDFYVIENNEVTLAEEGREIAPCEGVFVKATAENESVTFTKATSAKGNNTKNCFDLTITQGKANIDRARVRFGEGIGMEKFSLNNIRSQVSLWQDGKDFAVAYADGQDEMPVSFKVAKNGTYTLGIEHNSIELDYLHLIDNMTGDDIDLLTMPSYTFEAKTTDYASRFRLVFKANETDDLPTGSKTFAYISNGEIVIKGATNDATLQIVDVTGRVVHRTNATCTISTTGITAGVYVLRLITADDVKTQKLVVE